MLKLCKVLILAVIFGWTGSVVAQVITPAGYWYDQPWYPSSQANLGNFSVSVYVPYGSNSMFIDFYPAPGMQLLSASASGSVFYGSSFSSNRLYITVDPGYSGTATLNLSLTTNQVYNLGTFNAWSHIGCCSSGNGFGVRAIGPPVGVGSYAVKSYPSPANDFINVTAMTPENGERVEFVSGTSKRSNYVEQESYTLRVVDAASGTEIETAKFTNLNDVQRLSTAEYKEGTYISIVEKNGKTVGSSKFVVKH